MVEGHDNRMFRIKNLKFVKKGISRAILLRDINDLYEGSNQLMKAITTNVLEEIEKMNNEIKSIKIAMIELKKLCQKKN